MIIVTNWIISYSEYDVKFFFQYNGEGCKKRCKSFQPFPEGRKQNGRKIEVIVGLSNICYSDAK